MDQTKGHRASREWNSEHSCLAEATAAGLSSEHFECGKQEATCGFAAVRAACPPQGVH